MEPEDLEEILDHARRSNSRAGITGALVYVDRYFLQILEGETSRVKNLMDLISKDVRHETVTVLRETEISEAAFSNWEMAYISATPEQIAAWAGLGATTRVPEVLNNMHQDPQRAMQVAKGIFLVLANKSSSQTSHE